MSEATMSDSSPAHQTRTWVIDTDVHERGPLEELLPFLDQRWHPFITDYHWTPDKPNPFSVPAGAGRDRLDAVPTEGGHGGTDLDLLVRHVFEDAKIDVAILTGRLNATAWHPAWPEFKTALMSAYNDWQIHKWLDPEPRLLGSIHINAHEPLNAAAEIHRLGAHPKMIQVMMYVADYPLGDPFYHPIYEAAEQVGLPVSFHPSNASGTAFGFHRYYTEWKILVGPQSLMSTAISLVFNGVFERYPKSKVMLVEGGFTWLPSILDRADQIYRELRAEVPWVKALPSETVRNHIKFSSQPLDELSTHAFLTYIEQMGSDELVCYSSDYPHYDFDSPSEAFPPSLPDELMSKIMYRNALSFYGEKLERHLDQL